MNIGKGYKGYLGALFLVGLMALSGCGGGSKEQASRGRLSASQVSAGGSHTCALTSGGVKCWGDNYFGQLGDGNRDDSSAPVSVTGLSSGASLVSSGCYHTCALTTGGAMCWGLNEDGQLGDGTTIDRQVPMDVAVLSSGASAISAGEGHSCAMTSAGGVKCWGANGNGQLGDGTTVERLVPTDVSGLTFGVKEVAAGHAHSCALATTGGVKCWGANGSGQLGDGTTVERHAPTDVSGLASGIKEVAAGHAHSCALTTTGGVKCWGSNEFGQLGDGTTIDRHVPSDVSSLSSGVSSVSAGMDYTCALTDAGAVKCWGANDSGELGKGTINDESHIPIDVSGLGSGVSAVSTGYFHACALMFTGGVKCWGYNYYGQLGDGTKGNYRAVPVNVVGK